ncbi:HNH endonuclease [Oleidesulfovibrio alaskensis G20]|uniref:HNH endonuclease n=1 Tax=Oleidesulfovibrio alaskensis (strain ATCC BAA-1058 / DSM 17464 / G20) TaxID=207559 RepID=Q312Y0_OLEA2|nr:HNH endonuclease signature motif containing protein [Oleidesulfovibrio alaskensis]ABB38016.2 HNH endonuclease [Oleidesulfovibrio alaskensis G20]
MKQAILQAIDDFARGVRPAFYKTPRRWYLVHRGSLYPAKAIWAMATGQGSAGSFNTRDARAGLAEAGFAVRAFEPESVQWPDEDVRLAIRQLQQAADTDPGDDAAETLCPPGMTVREQAVFRRSPVVAARVLLRAGGFCECCGAPAPFVSRADNLPYLEVHHVRPLAEGGADTPANCMALCPNCHRQFHYGIKPPVCALSSSR